MKKWCTTSNKNHGVLLETKTKPNKGAKPAPNNASHPVLLLSSAMALCFSNASVCKRLLRQQLLLTAIAIVLGALPGWHPKHMTRSSNGQLIVISGKTRLAREDTHAILLSGVNG